MKRKHIGYIFITIILVAFSVLSVVALSDINTEEPVFNTSTFDEATPDQVATLDQVATPDETETTKPTQKATELETEAPTEALIETVTESTSENIIYTPIDHGPINRDPVEKPTIGNNSTPSSSSANNTSSTSTDVMLLAKVIYLEGGNCSEYCQWLIGSTAMNLADINGGLASVAYNYNIFNIAYLIDSCNPSSLSISVAERVLAGDRDYKVKAFRMNYYHNFGTPYTNVDNVYFSTY